MKCKMIAAAAIAIASTAAHPQQSPYAEQDIRAIKALSADETRQYLSGAGTGYARAAELNSYPGPQHALELADKLALTPSQRTATERLMTAHRIEARAIGAKLVEAERALDLLFVSGNMSESMLANRVRAAAAAQAEYRLAHLETHRRMRDILTPDQVRRYDDLRGYTGTQHGQGGVASHGKQQH